MKKRTSRSVIFLIVSIIFYVISALLIAFAVWTLIKSAGIFAEATELGQIPEEWQLYEIVNYYMLGFAQTGCAQYFVYSLLMATAATWFLLKRKPLYVPAVSEYLDDAQDIDDHDIDELFNEAQAADDSALDDAEPETGVGPEDM